MRIGQLSLSLLFPKRSKALATALQMDRLSPLELKQLQEEKLLRLLEHARKYSPYFNDYCKIEGVEDIGRLPLMTKDIIRENGEGIRAVNYGDNELKKNSTSGSSGDALHFFSDNKLDHIRQAIIMRGSYWAGYQFGDPSLLIWGSVADVNKAKNLKTKLAHSVLLFNQKILSSFAMKESDIERHIETLNSFRPTLVTGYPSSLDAISVSLSKKSILKHSPKGVITSGETLFEHQRERIESAFGCKVTNRYGTREVGSIASECTHQNGLHVHQDHVVVEILNEKLEPCKPGELGELVVTDLNNFGFPLIRYRIGDLAVKSNKLCSCGRPYELLERVEGRVFDLIVGGNGNRVPGNYFTLYFRKIPGIDQFQVNQKKDLSIKVLLKTNSAFTHAAEAKVKEGMLDKLGLDTKVEIEIVERIEPTASGKHRWVISEASPFVQ